MPIDEKPVTDERCPLDQLPTDIYDQLYAVRKLLDGQWALAVLCALTDGPKRYREILNKVQEYHITDNWSNGHKVLHESSLSRILNVLTRDELLLRNEKLRSFPPSVTYSLTEPAVTMLSAAGPLIEWANEHSELIIRAQKCRRN